MAETKLLSLLPLQTGYNGYVRLAELASRLESFNNSRLILDLRAMTWCDANLCSSLGALLHRAEHLGNTIDVINVDSQVEKTLCRNSFLLGYGRTPCQDRYGNTIQYMRFEPGDNHQFTGYLNSQLEGKAIPEMSPELTRRFFESLSEIFENASTHANSQMGVFACGQFFVKRNTLNFTVTDLGMGFRENIRRNIHLDLDTPRAIDWAMRDRNTTKQGDVPGGLGLKILREFIRLNGGKLQIVSTDGYWEQLSKGKVVKRQLPFPFPGSIVNIEINSADQKSYILSTKYDLSSLF